MAGTLLVPRGEAGASRGGGAFNRQFAGRKRRGLHGELPKLVEDSLEGIAIETHADCKALAFLVKASSEVALERVLPSESRDRIRVLGIVHLVADAVEEILGVLKVIEHDLNGARSKPGKASRKKPFDGRDDKLHFPVRSEVWGRDSSGRRMCKKRVEAMGDAKGLGRTLEKRSRAFGVVAELDVVKTNGHRGGILFGRPIRNLRT